jgi:hypothetical protein
MTPEERFAKIGEHLLVTAEMQRTSDRRWEERFAHHDEQIAALIRVAEEHQAELHVFRAATEAFFQRMDRFISGMESNGHK